ncbi:MAG: glycosyltransferase family 4 protein [Methanoregulaceae archaeon]
MKILFVARSNSIHTARWISQLSETGWDFYLFPSIDNGRTHQDLRNITIYHSFYSSNKQKPLTVRIKGFPVIFKTLAAIGRIAIKIFFPNYRKKQLKKIIQEIKPDIIHSLEFQAAGYLVLEIKKELKNEFPPWIATNWGSDIYHFGRFKDHKEKITDILSLCDYYQCECNRDIELAKKMGLTGKIFPVVPNTGGFDLKQISEFGIRTPPSSRKIIVLKGYQGWAGRALVGLRALELCADYLNEFTVVLYSADSPEVKIAAELFSDSTNIPAIIMPPSSHEDILKLFGQARIYLGLSISDAISTSLLEALIMGAFPIQSNTSCADEWIIDGKSGFIVPPEDPDVIASAIRKAITDDNLVDTAAQINEETAKKNLDFFVIREKVIELYTKLVTDKS